MKTAAQWVIWLAELPSQEAAMISDELEECISDLAAMEKLAIGGEGSTHFFYRDAWEAEKSRATHQMSIRQEAEAEALRRYPDSPREEEPVALVPTDIAGHAGQWVDADGRFYVFMESRPSAADVQKITAMIYAAQENELREVASFIEERRAALHESAKEGKT